MALDSRHRIRATRASPPDYARREEDRRQVYGAALAQFDELIDAAFAAGLASRPRPLALVSEETDGRFSADRRMRRDPKHLYGVVVGFEGLGEQLETYLDEHYPSAAGARLCRHRGADRVLAQGTRHGSGFLFCWQADIPYAAGQARTLNRIAPACGIRVPLKGAIGSRSTSSPAFEPRWLRPAVGGVALSSLLTWWALLFGLSMLARYEPSSWVEALDYDSSGLAAPLDQLLRIGLERVPELVFDALQGGRDAALR